MRARSTSSSLRRSPTALISPARDRLTIDVVVHEDGVAARWAAQATSGERIAITGPDGRYGADSETDWELAAKAWDDLQTMGIGGGGEPGIGL